MTACTIRHDAFRGWDACFLENAYVRLVAVPDIGGRVMAYDLGPYPFFFVDPDLAGKLFSSEENQGDGSLAAWKNYGGDKTWPAPQGWDTEQQWHGPPDPILDTGRYTLDTLTVKDSRAVLAMTSPPDPRTGVQITRRFTLFPDSTQVRVDLSFKNISNHPIRWSIWDVAQLRAERELDDGTLTHEPACTVTVPLNPNSKFPRGFNVMFGEPDNPQWQVDADTGLLKAPYQWHIGKVGLDSLAGWVAFSNAAAGYAFAEQFAVMPDAEYPDDGATVEIWTIGAGQVANLNYEDSDIYLMETEVLGPLQMIPPGEHTSFTINWGACRSPEAVVAVTEAGCLSAPLTLERLADGYGRVTISGGVFDAGELQLVWHNVEQKSLLAQSLGPVDPLTTLLLDRVVQVPSQAAYLSLRVVQADRQKRLAELEL